MRDIRRNSKGLLMVLLSALLLAGVSPASTVEVQAFSSEQTTVVIDGTVGSDASETEQETELASAFEIEPELLASDKDTYNISINVKNGGADWEGIARVSVDEQNRVPSVYDTILSLPQGSEKQFVVKVPKGVSDSSDSSLRVVLLDEKSKVAADKTFKKFLIDEMESLAMGILSDDYSSLTYLDMGGLTMYYYSSNMPVKLVELSQDNLMDSLESLTILVIDAYNTSVLTDEEKKAISLWIDNGGVLIVGTGSYVEDTLGGLEDIVPTIEWNSVVEPGTGGNNLTLNGDSSFDATQLALADLQANSNQYYESYFSYGLTSELGDGAVGIVPYSLVDLGKAGVSVFNGISQENYVLNMLEEMTSSASARYNRNNYTMNLYEKMSLIRRLLSTLGNSNNVLSFGGLKFLVVIYVIFVGPILYLILRFAKKREWYWVMVPVTAVVGICVIYFAGRGFEVASTRVYSVTTEDLSAKAGGKTYLYCFDAKYKEWSLQMGEGYEYMGPLTNDNYSYSDDKDPTKYYHRIQNEGGTLSFGIQPSSAFEDSFFYAGKANGSASNMGSISIAYLDADWTGFTGEVTNDTGKDFLYFAVIIDDTLYVYKDLPAGEKCSLGSTMPLYSTSQGYDMRSDYIYDFIRDTYDDGDSDEDLAALAALGVGIFDAYPEANEDVVVVCGVTQDWEKTVNDDCNEMSYGCLYTVIQ